MRRYNVFYWLGRAASWTRRRRRKRAAPPPPPKSPYRRFYTRDRSFEELLPKKRK